MAFLVSVCFVLLIFTCVPVHSAENRFHQYFSLISDIKEQYLNSIVCLLLPHREQYSQEYTLAYSFTREFSRMGMQTMVTSYQETVKFLDKHGKQVSRPLLVVPLRAIEDIQAFGEIKQKMKNVNPIWLLIFTDEFGVAICEYCTRPTGNMFGIRFDTDMLVSCCNDSVVKEWWSIHKNKTETAIFAKWTSKEGLKLLTKKNLLARRNKLNGVQLRVIVVPSSYYYFERNGEMDGFFIAVLKQLHDAMNFEMITHEIKSIGRSSRAEIVSMLQQGQADLAVDSFAITRERSDLVDFTLPFIESSMILLVREKDGLEVQWSAYLQPFSWPLWLMIISIIIGTTAWLMIIEARKQMHSFAQSFSMNYLNVWALFCNQGLSVLPTNASLRITYLAILVLAFVVNAVYSGVLMSYATVSTPTLPFSTVEGFANDGSYGLLVARNSVQWSLLHLQHDAVMAKMRTLVIPEILLPRGYDKTYEQVCSERVGLLTVEPKVYSIYKIRIPCNLHQIDSEFSMKLGMTLRSGSQYTEAVNYHLQRFRENGLTHRLKVLYAPVYPTRKIISSEVTLEGVTPIFSIFVGGIMLAVLILLCEILYANYRKSRPEQRLAFDTKRIRFNGYFNDYKKHRLSRLHLLRYPWESDFSNKVRRQYVP